MRIPFFLLAAGVVATCSPAFAATIWNDTFSTPRAAAPNPYDYPGGAAGNDYDVLTNSNTASVANGALNVSDVNASGYTTFVTTSQWNTAGLTIAAGDRFTLSADLRVNSLSSNVAAGSASVPRFSVFQNGGTAANVHGGLAGPIFTVGFSHVNVDADAGTELAFYRAANIAAGPTAADVIGYAGGVPAAGFDLGEFDATTATNNNTDGNFYRVAMVLTQGSSAVTGTLTNLVGGQTVGFSGTTLNGVVVDFASLTDPFDGIRFGTGAGGLSNSDVDNLSVDYTAVPEPAAAGAVAAAAAGGLLARRRRGRPIA